MDKYYIKENNWEVIYGLLQTLKTVRVRNKLNTRKFLEAVYFIMRTGAQWR